MKWLFWLLLTINLVFFATMQWGVLLTSDNNNLRNQPQLNAEKIKLLTAPPQMRAPVTLLPEVHAVTLPPLSAPVASQVKPLADTTCLEWGEFSESEFIQAKSALIKLKLGEKFSWRQIEYASGYWVYIPPTKSRAVIDRKISILKARGITDYFIVQEAGKWNNAISLGVFKTSEAAHKYLNKLSEKGIKTPLVGERVSKLKFTVFVLKNPDAELMEIFKELQKKFDGSELRSVACN